MSKFEVMSPQPVEFVYTNYKGSTSKRRVRPTRIWFGTTEHHAKPQWLLDAYDLDKKASRTFSIADLREWAPAQQGLPRVSSTSDEATRPTISLNLVQETTPVVKNCHACSFSYMGPNDDHLVCGHVRSGPFGVYVNRGPALHCGPDFVRFEQHPKRNTDGTLKP